MEKQIFGTLQEVAQYAKKLFVYHEKTKERGAFYSFDFDAMNRDDRVYMALSEKMHEFSMDEDSVYAFTVQAIDNIIDNHIDDIDDCDVMKWADNDIDVYTSDLTGWLNRSDSNVYYLSEALEEYGETDGFKALQIAQMKAREEIYQMVLEILSDFIDTDSEDKSDDD